MAGCFEHGSICGNSAGKTRPLFWSLRRGQGLLHSGPEALLGGPRWRKTLLVPFSKVGSVMDQVHRCDAADIASTVGGGPGTDEVRGPWKEEARPNHPGL